MCEVFSNHPEQDNYQSIDHGGELRYNSRGLTDRYNMLPSPDDMNGKPDDKGKRPHPSMAEPLEVRIRGLIQKQAYETPLGIKMWSDVKRIQKEYFTEASEHLNNSPYVHDKTQETLGEISRATNAQVIKGKECLRQLNTPALVVLNHYSGYKLTSFTPEDIPVADFGSMPELYPFPAFYASLYPAAKEIGSDVSLYDAHLEYAKEKEDNKLRRIQEEAGLLIIPEEDGGFPATLEATRKIVTTHPRSLLVVFPEGESSGKRNNGGPYDMVNFHTGAFVIAAELGLPVVPAVQYFNPEKGFQVSVLPFFHPKTFEKGPDGKPTEESKAYYRQVALEVHGNMQRELDILSGKVA